MGSNEIKLKLRSHISKLIDRKSNKKDFNLSYWEIFWKLPNSIDDIIYVFNPPDIKFLRDNNIKNFTNLLINVTNRLIYLSKLKKIKLSSFPTNQLLNCIRILTILIPFIYEKPNLNYLENEIFWNRLYHTPIYSKFNEQDIEENENENENSDDNDIYNDEEDDGIHTASATIGTSNDNNPPSPTDSIKVNHDEMIYSEKPIGSELINSLLNLLFTLNFTVESRSKTNYNSPILANDYQPIVWEPGLEVSGTYRETKLKLDSNRLEILRLLLVLFSKNLYLPVSEIVSNGSKFLTVLITATDGRKFYILCLSLWNLISRSIQSNDNTNNNMMMTNSLNSNLNGLDVQPDDYKKLRILLVTNSIQLFTLMIIYPLPKKDLSFLFKNNIISTNEVPRNRTRIFLSRISNSKDIQIIIKNLTTPLFKSLVDNDLGALSYLMKTSKLIDDKELNCWNLELLMIILEFFQCNAKFRIIFAELSGPEFFILLIYYILKFKNQKKYLSFVKLCIYFLLIITADIRLSSKLLISFDTHFYDSLPDILRISTTPTSYRDFLIIHICNIVNSDFNFIYISPLIESLYNLISLHAFVLEFNKRENKEIMVNRRIKDLSKVPPTQISYAASTSLVNLIGKLSKYNCNNLNDFINKLDLLSLILSSCCHSMCRDPYDTIILIYVLTRNSNILNKLTSNIKRVSDLLYTELLQKEKKDYDLSIQQQQLQLQHQIQVANNQDNQRDDESKDSIDMPNLSRQNTQTTLESIPSIRSMPIVTKQTSQISIPSVLSGFNNNFNDDSIDPINNSNNNKDNALNNSNDIDNTISNTNNNNSNNDNDPEMDSNNENEAFITDFIDEVFNAELPIGMTQKSKEKTAYYEKFENKWSGNESLSLAKEIIQIISNISGIKSNEIKNNQLNNASEIIHKLLKHDLDSLINNIEKPDVFNPKKIDYQPLKFRWTNVTLGWYMSLLWAEIFLNYNSVSSKGILAEISSGISAIKKASSSWGFGSWKLGSSSNSSVSSSPLSSNGYLSNDINGNNNNNNGGKNFIDLNVYYDNVLKRGIWFGTNIQLFRISPILLKEHYSLQHAKSDLSNVNNFGGNSSPIFSDVFWKRTSVNSPLLGMRNGSGVFTEGFWKRQGGRPNSIDRRDSDGSLKIQLSRNSISSRI